MVVSAEKGWLSILEKAWESIGLKDGSSGGTRASSNAKSKIEEPRWSDLRWLWLVLARSGCEKGVARRPELKSGLVRMWRAVL